MTAPKGRVSLLTNGGRMTWDGEAGSISGQGSPEKDFRTNISGQVLPDKYFRTSQRDPARLIWRASYHG